MNRNLHITIIEGPGSAPQGAAGSASLPGALPRRSGDPGSDYVLPPPEDPGSDYVLPLPEDPRSDYVLPPPEDPSGPYGWLGGAPDAPGTVPGLGAAVAAIYAGYEEKGPSCCCATTAEKSSVPQRPGTTPRDLSGFLIVRMAGGVESEISQSLWDLAARLGIAGLREVLELAIDGGSPLPPPGDPASEGLVPPSIPEPAGVLVSRPLIFLEARERRDRCEPPSGEWPRAETVRAIRDLEEQTAVTAFRPLHSLNAYWRLDLRPYPDLVDDVVDQLGRLAEVDLVYRELTALDPSCDCGGSSGEAFVEDQGYLADAPLGIGALWALQHVAAGDKVGICDLEQGWYDHEDLSHLTSGLIFGANRADVAVVNGHHGTAVLGQLAAVSDANAMGVRGAAAVFGQFFLTSHYRLHKAVPDPDDPFQGTNGHVAAALVNALVGFVRLPTSWPLVAGDVLLLEVQRGRLPTEIDAADLDAIRLASGLGVVVVEAAGNAGVDLDAYVDPETGVSLRRGDPRSRDSGAILVGASRAALPHDRAPFSNYGSRLDCFGWGEAVTTCGFGDLASGTQFPTTAYTNTFSGTSSASPIIAAAAALVQSLHRAASHCRLDGQAMRTILSEPATGTRQGPDVAGFIGVMPDLAAIVRGHLALVPDLYLRHRIGDGGGQPYAGAEVSSSPDILLWKGPPRAALLFGEGLRANLPAPGRAFDPGAPDAIYPARAHVRMRNRGGGEGEARVELFVSPAATLITPERWQPLGSVEVERVAQGDALAVSHPLPVDPPRSWPQDPECWSGGIVPPYSFLAVERPAPDEECFPGCGGTGLPPSPPYFDWAAYRAFLRRPGVAWRNVHAVEIGPQLAGQTVTLAFLVTGTPDQTHTFGLEVVQRLPASVEVTLEVPAAFAAKLRQRQPWLPNGSAALVLPRCPRTAFAGVSLAAGASIRAAFKVQVSNPAKLVHGHSLAIRQLWRGEEVGRITWWFVEPAK